MRPSAPTSLVERFHEERAAAHDAICARFRPFGILLRRRRVVIAAVPILAPLHDVAGHVERAVGRRIAVGLQLAALAAVVEPDRTAGVERLRADVVGIRTIDGVAPRILPLVGAARGLFPLGFGRQPILLARLGAEPVAVGRRNPNSRRAADSCRCRACRRHDCWAESSTGPGPSARLGRRARTWDRHSPDRRGTSATRRWSSQTSRCRTHRDPRRARDARAARRRRSGRPCGMSPRARRQVAVTVIDRRARASGRS